MGGCPMTPQERQLVDDLFTRLAALESVPRDAEAERAIAAGLASAPHAIYALVQTVLVQDEALKRANNRIRELEGPSEEAAHDGGFLGNMREAIFGGNGPRGSVPTVRPDAPNAAPVSQIPPQAYQNQGGSFLGTAASAAAGVVGGALLMGGIRSMFGGTHAGAFDPGFNGNNSASPWSGNADSDLARQAGINDVGNSQTAMNDDGGRAGLFGSGSGGAGDTNDHGDTNDNSANDDNGADFGDDSGDFDGDDFGGDDFGGDDGN